VRGVQPERNAALGAARGKIHPPSGSWRCSHHGTDSRIREPCAFQRAHDQLSLPGGVWCVRPMLQSAAAATRKMRAGGVEAIRARVQDLFDDGALLAGRPRRNALARQSARDVHRCAVAAGCHPIAVRSQMADQQFDGFVGTGVRGRLRLRPPRPAHAPRPRGPWSRASAAA